MEIPTGESGQALADQSGGEPFAVTGTCIHSDIQTPFSSFSIFPTPHNPPLSVNLQLEGEQLQTLSVSCALGASVESVRERVCGEGSGTHSHLPILQRWVTTSSSSAELSFSYSPSFLKTPPSLYEP